MFIVYEQDELRDVVREVFSVAPGKPVLLDKFLEDAIELDVDCISDGDTTVIGGMLEHIEEAGVHSGDAGMIMPPHTLSAEMLDQVREVTYQLAKEFNVIGLMNIQFAIQAGELFMIEVNPRASRTIPFVSKAIGVPLAKLAAKVMNGHKLKELGFTEEIIPPYWCAKEAVFPFVRFPGSPIVLAPEMRSTGEVMGLDDNLGMAFAKAQTASNNALPLEGSVFLSVKDSDKPTAVEIGRELADLGYEIFSTSGTADILQENGVPVNRLYKIREGRPNAVDMIKNGDLHMIINTPSGMIPRRDEDLIRSEGLKHGVCIISTLSGAKAAINGIRSLKKIDVGVEPLQAFHPRLKK